MKTQKLHKHICILLAMMITVSVACGVLFATGGRAAVRNAPGASQDEITTVKTRGGDWDTTTGPQETINRDNVNAVIEAIHSIGAVEFTSESLAGITAARTAYNALNDREKREVSNYGDLTDAEAAFRNLSQGHDTAVRLIRNGAVDGVLDTHANRVYFGNYSQQTNADPGPVLWRILDHSGGRMLLLSDKILAVKPYHISFSTVQWTACSLRTWLNSSGEVAYGETDDSFLNNAFNSAERLALRDTDVNDIVPSGGAGQGSTGGENNDKVFILSGAEVMETTFGFPVSTAATYTRAAQRTAVAQSQASGAWTNDSSWWLRDTDAGTSRWVHNDGQVTASSDTGSYTQSNPRGVRPAVFIDLSRVLFASPASGGKNADGALANIPTYTGKEWKLTVRNINYKFTVSENTATAGRGETVTLNYTKAKYGSNDRISAILVNEDGNPVYYGQIARPASAAGSVDITVPQDIIPGNYTLRVFNEQLNGDYATDSASAFSDVALTVPCRHNWGQSSVTGSCKTSITRNFTCRICGETYTETEAGSGSHTWQEARREGSDEDGWTVWYYCTVCEAAWTKIIEPEHRQLNEAIVAIESIGKVEYTQECAALIDNARTKYNELPARFKPLVTNYSDLTDAEAKYAALAQGITDEPDPPAVCEYCGEVHTGFFGKIETFFHRFLRFLGLVNLLPDSPEEEPVSSGF